MSGASTAGPFKLTVDPRNDQYDPDDDRWLDQVGTLSQSLDAQVEIIRDQRQAPGAKGAVDQLIIALGSAGAFQAAVDCFRAWLGRDRDRRIDIRWSSDGAERSVTLTGEAVDAETIRAVAKAAASQLGGPPWPAGTGHS
jgi:Effector Associated Constant Component 1